MKILFMMPVDLYQGWPLVNDTIRHHQILPGCAFPQLAAMAPDHDVEIYDGLAMSLKGRLNKRFLVNQIRAADVVGINVVSELVALNTEVNLNLIRCINPGIHIVLGGFHSTFYHKEWIERGVDVVIRNEGELAFRDLLNAWEAGTDLRALPGITFRESGKAIVNPDREFIKHLDDLPFPRFDLLQYGLYRHGTRRDGWSGTVESSRGCMHPCSFCWDRSMWRGRQRFKSAERVLEELEFIYRKGVRYLWFTDNNFGANAERDMTICEEMIRKNLDFSWGVFIRGDTIHSHPELITVAARAGLIHTAVGYEFTSAEMLQSTRKKHRYGLGIEKYRHVYKGLKQKGIFVLGLYLTGFDSTMKLADTPNYSFALQTCDMATWNSLIPHRGTQLYQEIQEKNVPVKDLFYHIRLLPIYENPDILKQDPSFRYNLRSLVGAKTLWLGFFGTRHARAYIRGIWKMIVVNLFRIRYEKIKNFLILSNGRRPPSQREERIRSYYLSDRFVEYWLGDIKR